MAIYTLYIFNRHCECIYHSSWKRVAGAGGGSPPPPGGSAAPAPAGYNNIVDPATAAAAATASTAAASTAAEGGGGGGGGGLVGAGNPSSSAAAAAAQQGDPYAIAEEAKLVYGVVFSLKNMVSKLLPRKNSEGFLSYKTSTYKLHYFETPSCLRFVLTTDPASDNMRETLRQIYSDIYVEYVVKNPLVKHGGVIRNELFRTHLNSFIRSLPNYN
ncbi:Sybindin-like protein [Zopfochytrium polystomum]|nr:Sybindin-like protein [Zopfochytrium polystomum]